MEFREFTQSDLDATSSKWENEALDFDCFPEEVQQKLKPVQEALTASKSSGFHTIYYGVFKANERVAAALCEMVLSDRGTTGGKWLKMLKLSMSPEIETLLIQEQIEAINTAINVYKAAVSGAFAARLTHDADTLKLYGRSDEQLKFLMMLLSFINQEHSHELSAKKEGRWLVLRSTA